MRKVKFFKDDFAKQYDDYLHRKIATKSQWAKMLNISRATLDILIKDFEEENYTRFIC